MDNCLNFAKKYIFAQKKILNHPTVIMQPFIQKFFINFLFVQSLLKQLGLNIKDINEMAERFSTKKFKSKDQVPTKRKL